MIAAKYAVDFNPYALDMAALAGKRMLGQFYNKSVFAQFLNVFIAQCQNLYANLVEAQRHRTLYTATGEDLQALGRIVGASDQSYSIADDRWMTADTAGSGFDQKPVWCLHAPLGTTSTLSDDDYRTAILAKIQKNMLSVPSALAVQAAIKAALGVDVSFQKTGPYAVTLLVHADLTEDLVYKLTSFLNTAQCARSTVVPYPVTLAISGVTSNV